MSEPRYLEGDEYALTGTELDIVKCKECASEYDYAEYHSYTCSDCEDKMIARERESMSKVCNECGYPTWWVDNGCNKCGYEVASE